MSQNIRKAAEYSNREFKVILTISILFHLALLVKLPALNILIPAQKSAVQTEIVYEKAQLEQTALKELTSQAEERMQKLLLKKEAEPVPEKAAAVPPYTEGGPDLKTGEKLLSPKITIPEVRLFDSLEAVSLPDLDSSLIKNPHYAGYYQVVRGRIKSVAVYEDSISEEGAVHLKLLLDSKGNIKALQINDEKSTSNRQLRELAADFVKKAAPYPPFPKQLTHQDLLFHVIIEFRAN